MRAVGALLLALLVHCAAALVAPLTSSLAALALTSSLAPDLAYAPRTVAALEQVQRVRLSLDSITDTINTRCGRERSVCCPHTCVAATRTRWCGR